MGALFEQFTQWAYHLIGLLGYGGLAVGLVVDSAGIPIPSEVLLPLAGALVREGRFDLIAVIVVGTLAQTAGALLAYAIGASGGLALVQRYGKYVLFSNRELELTEHWFARYGQWLTLAGRCLPIIRTYIGFPAGIARMPLDRFLLASLAGSLFWTIFLTLLGYHLAGQIEVIQHAVDRFSAVILGLLIAGVIWYVRRHRRKNRRKK